MNDPRQSLHRALAWLQEGKIKEAKRLVLAELKNGERADLRNTLGLIHEAEGDSLHAIAAYRRADALSPDTFPLVCNLANALRQAQRWDDAEAAYARALALEPGQRSALRNLAATRLLRGDYQGGWPLLMAARQPGINPAPAMPPWQGEPLAGRTILLYERQGYGDIIQFLRYVPLLLEQGAHVILETPPALHPLIAANYPAIRLVAKPAAEHCAADCHCSLMELPVRMEMPHPAQAPRRYLSAPAAPLAGPGRLRVGVTWMTQSGIQIQRLCPFATFAGLFHQPNVDFFTLAVGSTDGPLPANVQDLRPQMTDFWETAKIVAGLDLVICIDTAAAHLAGAMGVETWVILPYLADWRWGIEERTPWYDGIRLFRQRKPRDWSLPLRQVERLLSRKAAPPHDR